MKSRTRPFFWFVCFMLATVFAGLFLRWQMTGLSLPSLSWMDWRRAHSHLGFYGVLFPLSWICLQGQGAWLPNAKLWLIYGVLVAASGISFLLQGYGFFSIVASTGILAIWLLFAWKNRSHMNLFKKDWLSASCFSIFLSSVLIIFVAVMTRRDPALANQLARSFLTLLLFGVFLPATLRTFQGPAPFGWAWFLSTLSASVYLTDLLPHPVLGAGPVWLAYWIGRTVWPMRSDLKLNFFWLIFALSLALTGFGFFPYSYFQAIAGIHFFILGPLFLTFLVLKLKAKLPSYLRWVHELSLILMVSGISLQNFITVPLQRTIAFSSLILVINLCFILYVLYRDNKANHLGISSKPEIRQDLII